MIFWKIILPCLSVLLPQSADTGPQPRADVGGDHVVNVVPGQGDILQKMMKINW